MRSIYAVHPDDFVSYQTDKIRERFLLDDIVQPNQINLVYTHYDRMIIGGANPIGQQLELPNYPNLKADFFLQRREMGIINVAGNGEVIVDGRSYPVNKLDCLYIGRGVQNISFASTDSNQPAVFYILSCPAHVNYPTVLMNHAEAIKVNAGDASTANKRTINKYIHTDGIQSCQLVMGLTTLAGGSVWNTMPAHTHDRRMEAYFYFDVPEGQRVFHYMGEGNETRHIILKNHVAVVSPPWSIHAGSGTANYSFIWGMAGENLDYTDMDMLNITDLK